MTFLEQLLLQAEREEAARLAEEKESVRFRAEVDRLGGKVINEKPLHEVIPDSEKNEFMKFVDSVSKKQVQEDKKIDEYYKHFHLPKPLTLQEQLQKRK